jgi:hypothetical protein
MSSRAQAYLVVLCALLACSAVTLSYAYLERIRQGLGTIGPIRCASLMFMELELALQGQGLSIDDVAGHAAVSKLITMIQPQEFRYVLQNVRGLPSKGLRDCVEEGRSHAGSSLLVRAEITSGRNSGRKL